MSFSTMRHGGRHMLHHYRDEEGVFFDPDIAKRLLAYLKPHWKKMLLGGFMMIVSTAMQLLAPYLIKVVIDAYITKGDWVGLSRLSLLLMAVYVTRGAAMGAQMYVLSWVGQNILNRMRQQLFSKYQRLSLAFHSRHEVGSLISRVLSDVGVLNELISSGFISMISDLLFLVGTVAVMLSISWRLALLTFSVMPLMVLATYLFSRRARGAYRETREAIGALTGDMAEGLANMRVVQAFSQEGTTSERFEVINRTNRDANIRAMTLSYIFMPTADLLNTTATAIVLWLGGVWVAQDQLTLGVIVSFMTYVARFFQPIRDLSQIYTTFQAAMAGGERVFGLLDEPLDIENAPDAMDPGEIHGRVTLDDVYFQYEQDVPVLEGINLDIKPGQTIALVGPTGAGKTTIAALISRFYDVVDGQLLIDGQDIREIDLHALRSQLGVVPQEPFLFQITIGDNIRFSRPDATDEEVRQAAELANAADFIADLPESYDTMVMEGSTNLSLGQRQLLCFARAILAEPAILILDEATSSVDTRTELLIQEALSRLLAGRTAIVIAHRLSTIREADMICYVYEGRIVERGTHDELMALGGHYFELYDQQFAAMG
jgi:ABC-type multidrug transport system fused ATPase/permease subunit